MNRKVRRTKSTLGTAASPESLQMDAVAAFQQSDMALASKLFGRLARLQPNNAEAHYNHGVALQGAGLFERAVRAYLSTIRLAPSNPTAYNNLGDSYETLKRLADAEAAYRKAIQVAPDRPEAINNLGLLEQCRGNLSQAEVLFRRCLEIIPNQASVLFNLGNVLMERGRLGDAIVIYKKALEKTPDDTLFLKYLGMALQSWEQNEEARDIFNSILEIDPGSAEAHINLADQSYRLGEKLDAEHHVRQALGMDPDNADAYYLLMKLKTVTDPKDKDLTRVITLLGDASLDDEKRVQLNFSASLAFQDLGEDVAAFRHLKAGNDTKCSIASFDMAKERSRFKAIKKIFNVALKERMQGVGLTSKKPIFIVGMPRSGTSLSEQILSSHSAVYGAGELKSLGYQIEQISSADATYPEGIGEWSQEQFAAVAGAYLEDISIKGDDAERVTDKLPANFLYIGMIRLALPDAKIIHCTRDAMDTCFSCYQQNFSTGQLFSNDLTDLGNYYRLYQDLMSHWNTLFPSDIYELSYEKTVEDPEASIRDLLEFCELKWQDNCLSFHANKRQVQTASALQVRQPIYKSSLKAWKRHEIELAPLVKALKV
jgi:Flp pilus assembly protein TadD